MPPEPSALPTRVATLALPTRESHVSATAWPSANGTLLVVAEFNLALAARQQLTAALSAAINRSWKQAPTAETAEQALEYLLLDLNQVLSEYRNTLGNPLAPRCHLVVAVLHGTQLALSHLGYATAYIAGATRMANLFVGHGSRASSPSFQNLITGKFGYDEVLVLATPSLLDYVSPARLRELITYESPGTALREVENTLTALPHHEAVAVACLRFDQANGAAGTGPSMQRLLATQAATNLWLKPRLWTFLTAKFKSEPRTTASQARLPVVRGETRPEPTTAETAQPQPSKRTARHVSTAWVRLGNLLRTLSSREQTKAALSAWLGYGLMGWRKLALPRRVLLVVALVLIVAFFQSIVEMGRSSLRAHDSEAYNRLVSAITERSAEAEAALIYHDETRASTLVAEASALLGGLPRTSPSREAQWAALQKALAVLNARLEHRASVASLPTFAKLPQPSAETLWRTLTAAAGNIYAANNQGTLVSLDAAGGIKATARLPGINANIISLTPLTQELLVTAQGGQQAILDLALQRTTVVEQPLAAVDLATYADKLYLIGGDPRTLLRSSRQANGFTAVSRWLKPAQGALTDATSLAVDGSIYVARGQTVDKYVLGLKRDFALTPALRSPIAWIRTGGENDNLYLWTKNQTLAVYTKQGKLVVELQFPTLPPGSSAAYDAGTKSLMLLKENQIYRVPLTEYLIFGSQ